MIILIKAKLIIRTKCISDTSTGTLSGSDLK